MMADPKVLPPPAEFQAATDFDQTEPQAKGIFIFSAATILFLLLTMGGIAAFFGDKIMGQIEKDVLEAGNAQFEGVKARDHEHLTSYGYVDAQKGVVRIPIDKAIDLLAAEAAAGKLPYPAKPTEVKPDPAAAVAVAPAAAKPASGK